MKKAANAMAILHRIQATGDREGYEADKAAMRAALKELGPRVALLHHGDGDGVLGAALLARWFRDRGCEVSFTSRAEFREADLPHFLRGLDEADAGVFVEAEGMPPAYASLDDRVVNIDHHPEPPPSPFRRTLNPRRRGFAPVPCVAQVIWDLLADDLPDGARFLAALGALVDRAPEAAKAILLAEKSNLVKYADLEATFHAVQYASPLPERLADLLSGLPGPDEILFAEPFAGRRRRFLAALDGARVEARGRLIVSEVEPLEDEAGPPLRIASPLANRLSHRNPDRTVVVVDRVAADRLRLSVRAPGGYDVGDVLARAAAPYPRSDGCGHERAGSARIPREALEAVLEALARAAAAAAA